MTVLTCMLSFLVATAVAIFATPLARALARRVNFLDHPGGVAYKIHETATPYLGGLPIALGVVISLLALDIDGSDAGQIWTIFGASCGCAIVGIIDDRRTVPAWLKLLCTLVFGGIVWSAGVRTNFSDLAAVDVTLTALWLSSITHSFNILDNMDGVAAGTAVLGALSYCGIALTTGQTEFAIVAAALVGASLGFLPFNFRPATIFLGDMGTLFLGFSLASIGLALDVPGASIPTRSVTAILIMGVPLFNLLLVLVSRGRAGRPLTQGGTDGVAHRLTTAGLSKTEAAIVFWVAGATLGATGVLLSALGPNAAILTGITASCCGMVVLWAFERVDMGARDRGAAASSHTRSE